MLDVDLAVLRTFVSVAEAGGFTSAGVRVHRTQSTISLQIRKLEESVGRRLLHRSARSVALTADGERLLTYARRILALADDASALFTGPLQEVVRLGVPEDYAVEDLPRLLADFTARHPEVLLEVRCDLSVRLIADLDNGDLDLTLIKQTDALRPAIATSPDPLVWAAGPGVRLDPAAPLPLVVFPQGCVYRNLGIHELARHGRPWRIAYSSASLMGVLAAVRAGLGISMMAERGLPADFQRLGPADGLPALPDGYLALFARKGIGKGAQAALALLTENLETLRLAA